MASINRRQTSRGPRWDVRWRPSPGAAEECRTFDRAEAARNWRHEVENDRRDGIELAADARRVTFAQMADRWRAVADHVDSSALARDRDLRLHLLPLLGPQRMMAITSLELEGVQRRLVAISPATAARCWTWASAVFTAAVKARVIRPHQNPMAEVAWPAPPPRPPLVPLEPAGVAALVGALPGHYQALAVLAAYGGLRQAEATGLAVSRVGLRQLRSGLLAVERQLISGDRRQPYLRLPKGAKVRSVPVPEAVTDVVAAHLARFGPGPRVPDRLDKDRPEMLVFASARGRPVIGQLIDGAMQRAVARAGLPKGTRFHDLRHFYAAVLIDAGLSEREIGARLGHSAGAVTARYGHLFPNADERTRRAVMAVLSRGTDRAAGYSRDAGSVADS